MLLRWIVKKIIGNESLFFLLIGNRPKNKIFWLTHSCENCTRHKMHIARCASTGWIGDFFSRIVISKKGESIFNVEKWLIYLLHFCYIWWLFTSKSSQASPKTEKIETSKVERTTKYWNLETKLASLEHSFIWQ